LWSVLDVWVLLLGLLTGVLGMTSTHVTPAVSSVAVFFSWLKVFYFLRAFTTTGSLVRMVVQIGYDMRYLLVLLIVVMFAAASAFFVLMPMHYAPGESDTCYLEKWREALDAGDAAEMATLDCVPPLSYWDTILQAFAIMLGAFDITAFDSLLEYRVLGQGLFIVYAVFQMVLLLNLLIALMGDSYEKVQEKAKTEALRERAGLLVEIELVAGQRYLQRNHFCPRWLHALVPKETLQVSPLCGSWAVGLVGGND
jgi:cytochrome b subunit of formate dehydrogenase